MAEMMSKDEDVITADSVSIPPKPPDGPTLVKVQKPESVDRPPATSEPHAPVF
jgi:hypothetical protein